MIAFYWVVEYLGSFIDTLMCCIFCGIFIGEKNDEYRKKIFLYSLIGAAIITGLNTIKTVSFILSFSFSKLFISSFLLLLSYSQFSILLFSSSNIFISFNILFIGLPVVLSVPISSTCFLDKLAITFLYEILSSPVDGANFENLVSSSSGSSTSSITVAGSTTCLPIAEIAAEGFKEETGIDVLVSGLGSSAGIEAVSNGTADIASSSRGLNADEQDLGLTPIVIAHDGIAVIVNDDNPVDNLSTGQLRDIYAGKITNWKEVGGEDLKIQVINRDEASGTREAFRTIVMDGTPFDRRSAVLSGTGQVRDVVSRSRGAIGYISLGFVDSLNAKTSVKAASVNHVEASEKTVASGGYPISRDLYFFVKGAPSQQAQDYIDYVTSEKMDKQIREAGFIPVTNDEKGSE